MLRCATATLVLVAASAGCLPSYTLATEGGSTSSGTGGGGGAGGAIASTTTSVSSSSNATSSGMAGAGGSDCSGGGVGPYVDEVISDAPVGYWRFEDPPQSIEAGATVGPALQAADVQFGGEGVLGAAARFTHVPDSFMRAFGEDAAVFAFIGDEPTTIEVWSLPEADTVYPFTFDKANFGSGINTGLELWINIEHVTLVAVKGDGVFNGAQTGAADLTGWTHVVAQHDPVEGRLSVYVDGMPAASFLCFDDCRELGNTGPMNIGGHPNNGQPYLGALDELAIYRGLLTPDRICRHHSAGRLGR